MASECTTEISPLITSIINASLSSSKVPNSFNVAHVRPLLKNKVLIKKLKKLSEKVVSALLTDHLKSDNLIDYLQSTYRVRHSTELLY